MSDDYKRRLWIVIALNATIFVVEIAAGYMAQSQALQADALNFLGDALTYGISLAVIGNVAVMFVALGVWGTATGWPDLIVAASIAGLFLSSAFQIVRQALEERRAVFDHDHAEA